MEKESKQYISWSANEDFAQRFGKYYELAQIGILNCRQRKRNLTQAFDHIHEIYRMEYPYILPKEQTKLKERHDDLQIRVNNFSANSDNPFYVRNNFLSLFMDVDSFFMELTQVAVDKQFFPKVMKDRSIKEITENGLRQR